ncbi:MAG TPA: hypothetical protein DCM27_00530 [Rhodospirillaceae bacterium]|nr:hypothetical protein [Rhodospirillaceae bacterium]
MRFTLYGTALTPGSQFYVWGRQAEQDSSATSYIPTTATAVIRISDDLSFLSGAALSEMQSSNGTFAVETNNLRGGAYSKIISNSSSGLLEEGENASRIGSIGNGGPYFLADLGTGTLSTGSVKSAVSWSASTRALVGNGGSVATSTGTMAVRDAIYIGSKAKLGNYIEGHVKSFKFYPLTATNTQLQLMTQ